VTRDRTVLVASGDRLFAAAASRFLMDHRWQVVATVHDGLHALSGIGRFSPNAVLVLGDLPRLGPPALARQIRRRWPEVQVVVLGGPPAEDATPLPADARGERVLAALAGSPRTSRGGRTPEERPDSVVILRSLTSRERLILKLLAEGLPVRDLAEHLNVSRHTIRTHMQNLYAKLDAHSRLDVVRFAAQHGLVGSEAEDTAP
jgi:DNA-binding NarL/FixJ family response regulator